MKTYENWLSMGNDRFQIRDSLKNDVATLKKVFSETREGTPADTVAAFVASVGYDRAAVAIASAANRHSWDGRISRKNAAWAESIESAWDEETCRNWGLYVDDKIHLANFDQIISAFRKVTPPEDPKKGNDETETDAEQSAPADPETMEAPETVEAEQTAPEAQEITGQRLETISENEQSERKEAEKSMKFEKAEYYIIGRFENGNQYNVITKKKVVGYLVEGIENIAFRKEKNFWYIDHVPSGMRVYGCGYKTRTDAVNDYNKWLSEKVTGVSEAVMEKQIKRLEETLTETEVAAWETVNFCDIKYNHRIEKLEDMARSAGLIVKKADNATYLKGGNINIIGDPVKLMKIKMKISEWAERDAERIETISEEEQAAPADLEAQAAPEAEQSAPADPEITEAPEAQEAEQPAAVMDPETVKAEREKRKAECLETVPEKWREHVAAVVEAFPAVYNRLYNECRPEEYRKEVQLFNAWIETPLCNEFICHCANVRGDCFISDREAAAFVIACRECNARRKAKAESAPEEQPAQEAEQAAPEEEQPAPDAKTARGPVKHKDFLSEALSGRGWCIVFDSGMQRTRVIVQDEIREKAAPMIEEAGFYWSGNMRSYNRKLTHKAHRAALALAEKLQALA